MKVIKALRDLDVGKSYCKNTVVEYWEITKSHSKTLTTLPWLDWVCITLVEVIWLISSGQVRSLFRTSISTWARSATPTSSSVASSSSNNIMPAG
ncbi:hypothetical protein E2C01_012850 [Portunus trituberculatus]|uniref:Uncharacterized protein n=1 Tax=Portunus trituberculatus TaxID=210409 RepID=A0A5B7DEQ1_PORTR|nr:hypothetical protein [Portunus trituberculatus]